VQGSPTDPEPGPHEEPDPGQEPGTDEEPGMHERAARRAVVAAFLTASREGDFQALLELLDPDVVLRADAFSVAAAAAHVAEGAPVLRPEVRGMREVARSFAGRARASVLALVDGAAGAAWAPDGQPRAVFHVQVRDGRISAIEIVSDPDRIARTSVELLPD
jgi:ketosteroid isomerase-like protein